MTGSHFLAAPAYQRTVFRPRPAESCVCGKEAEDDDSPTPILEKIVQVLMRHKEVYDEVLAAVRTIDGWERCTPDGLVT
jgi:hypothetical protein